MIQDVSIYLPSPTSGALRQGEILSYLIEANLDIGVLKDTQTFEVVSKVHPYVIVMTQDCDLDWDYKERLKEGQSEEDTNKRIPNVFFCELETASVLRDRPKVTSDIWKRIANNRDERYHFFEK